MATSEPPVQFEEIREREGELSARQRRTLDLIVAGKTNAEIADEFGISLAGAKWHVSEILSKLGLGSREDAADYWRWRKRRRVPHALRALAGLPALKWVAGGVGAAGAVAAVAVFVTGPASSPTPVEATERPEAIYFEAEYRRSGPDAGGVIVTGDDAPPGAAGWVDLGGGQWASSSPSEERLEVVHVWQEASDRFRLESEVFEPALESGERTIVAADGNASWRYGSQLNTWSVGEVARATPPNGPWELGMIGDRTYEALLQRVREEELAVVNTTGGGTVAGRKTVLVEAERRGMRWSGWFDSEWGLLLKYRHEMTSVGVDLTVIEAQVTSLRAVDAAPGLTAFTPPTGSQHRPVDSRPPGDTFPHGLGGFAPVAEAPDGWASHGCCYSGHNGADAYIRTEDDQWYYKVGGEAVVGVERRRRADGFPAALHGDVIGIAGRTVEHSVQGGEHVIAWADGEVITEVRGFDATRYEDVALIATAMFEGPLLTDGVELIPHSAPPGED